MRAAIRNLSLVLTLLCFGAVTLAAPLVSLHAITLHDDDHHHHADHGVKSFDRESHHSHGGHDHGVPQSADGVKTRLDRREGATALVFVLPSLVRHAAKHMPRALASMPPRSLHPLLVTGVLRI